ncbi:hypothetical protein KC19_12G067500 [Ceratodon purpureus]|uniref:Large ribosomal subunit protein mL45 n=1 Tax=Ceratodon purpureus TaxID=3225 RepID=A0A8T0G6S3_CERPU|nr:hypothetical protein KC19_12G067500 [Ceratodon purpureus]
MGHVLRYGRRFASQLGFSGSRASLGIGELCGGDGNGKLLQSLLGSVRGFAISGESRLGLRDEGFLRSNERLESSSGVTLGARDGLSSLLGSSASFSRSFSSNSASLFLRVAGMQATTTVYGLGFHQRQDLITFQSAVRGDRGFAKAVALPPQMQKPMKLRVYMGSPGVIGEPWKPLPPPLPFLKRWFTKEGWKIRKQNVQGMLKTGFTLAKIRQKTKGYNQTKFYRDTADLYKEINTALATGDRSALRQLVTDNVLTTMKKELKHREQAWARVHWELVGPLKSIRTLQGRLIGIDQKNMDTAFAQLTLRIISNQVRFWKYLSIRLHLICFHAVHCTLEIQRQHFWPLELLDTLRMLNYVFVQKFAAYDKHGKLVAGDPEKELKVEDIWVFERQISHPELRWKLCGRLSV